MSVFKDVLRGRFWIGVAMVLASVIVVSAVGAAAITWGITPMDWMVGWWTAAWLIGGFSGARVVAKEENGVLTRALLVAVAAFVLVCLFGLTVQGDMELKEHGLLYGASLLVGAMAAALMRPKKKRRAKMKKKGGDARAKKR